MDISSYVIKNSSVKMILENNKNDMNWDHKSRMRCESLFDLFIK